MLKALNLKGDEIFSLKPIDSNRSHPLPEVISARTLFTEEERRLAVMDPRFLAVLA